MDTTDPDIRFDASGVCHHCHEYDERIRRELRSGAEGEAHVARMVVEMKRSGRGKPYDCVIGVSGGVDSTYVALKIKELGLRPLAVHLDNGWDSELAVKNIENTLQKLDIPLYTKVLDWEEFRDLQLAFLRASTPDSEIPSDHAIFAEVRHVAAKHGIKYIIGGQNLRTESHLPLAWSQGHADWTYIKAVHRQFGTVPLRSYPHQGFWTYRRYLRTQVWFDILNFLDYSKTEAMEVLERELGWRYYGGKHYESIYTRFYQGYILPRKFGYDKRRVHLSSLICAGEISREQALEQLTHAPYPVAMQEEDREYVCKKLGLTDAEFAQIMALPHRSYWDFPSQGHLYRKGWFKALRAAYLGLKKLKRTPAPSGAPTPAADALVNGVTR